MDDKRLIDAEKLTTNIAQIAKNCARSDAQKALIGRILFMIENMPTVDTELDNGWISVDDRLPEIKEHYRSELVICYSPDGEHECLFDYYEVNGFGQGCFTAEKYFGITITHWQPLPEPPKGECK